MAPHRNLTRNQWAQRPGCVVPSGTPRETVVHVHRAERLPAVHHEVAELARLLRSLRWRLGVERLLLFGLRGLIASGIALIGFSLVVWLMPLGTWEGLAWIVGLPFGVAVALG